jgi:hypothetical protein
MTYGTVQALNDESGASSGCHAAPIDPCHQEAAIKLSYRAVLTPPVVSILISTIAMVFASETLFAV